MTVKLTWLSHSGFKLDLNGTTVLIDPFLTGNPLASSFDPQDMHADYILLTHAHGDHLGDTVDIANRSNAMVIGVAEIEYWMQKQGVQRTHAQNTGGGYKHPFGHVKFVRANHSSSFPDGTYAGNPCGIVLTVENKRLYFAGDTDLYSDMRLIGDMGIDIAFLPIGDNFTMGPDESLKAIDLVHPRSAFPIHYNTFEVIQQDVVHWAKRVHNETDAKAIVTDPGLEFVLD
jgi:L-ascorbate metabolism protein UlaG (beta-lactamase superfamily)